MKNIILSSSIRDIIGGNGVYIDKTEKIQKMIEKGWNYFLARPRRFWKTLTINTFIEILKGNKALFANTYIGKSWYKFEKIPVIFLDMTNYTPKNFSLEEYIFLKTYIYYWEEYYNLKEFLWKFNYKVEQFSLFNIIEVVFKHYKKKVSIFIDEYDKAVLNFYDNEERNNLDFKILSSFYPWLKEAYNFVLLSFVTWLSKLFQQHAYSGLNNLQDINENKYYYDLIWFTEKEIKENFWEHLLKMANEEWISVDDLLSVFHKKANWYNFWNKYDTIFNSWSIINILDNWNINRDYWTETWTLSIVTQILYKMFKEKKEEYRETSLTIQLLINNSAILIETNNFEFNYNKILLQKSNILMLLYFAGYLTKKVIDNVEYFIVPNDEARKWLKSLQNNLWEYNLKWPWDIIIDTVYDLINSINKNDKVSFKNAIDYIFKNVVSQTPAFLFTKNDKTKRVKESEFQTTLAWMFRCTNFVMQIEMDWIAWRADIVLYDNQNEKVYIFELKSFNKVWIEEVIKQWEKYVQQTKAKIENITWGTIKNENIYVIALSLTNQWILFDFKHM